MKLTTNTLDTIIAGLTPAQLNFRPTPTAWNIPGILEHMVLVEEYTLGPLQSQLATTNVDPEAPVAEVDAFITHAFADRTHKVEAPPFIHPTGKPTSLESLKRLMDNHNKLIALLEQGKRARSQRIPAMPLEAMSGGKFKTMDGHQWVLATFAHNERHTNQILEWIALTK